jgi:hypothetical protein
MNPERVTTSQFFGSFTVTHWVATITVIFACISSIAGGAYWAGQKLTEAQSFGQQAELKATVAQLQAKLEVAQSRAESLASANVQWHDAHQKLQEVLAQKSVEISQLSTLLGRANNCTFIHEQIRATRAEMDSTGSLFLIDTSKEGEEKQKTRKTILEKRLEGYQQQLGSCNK